MQSLGTRGSCEVSECCVGAIRAFVAVGLALHLLTACSSIHNQTVAAGGLFVPVPPKPGYATVYIGRPYTFHTSVFALPIQVDDKPVMSLPPGQYTAVQLAPGPHSVGSPNEAWTRAISGVPHPANFAVEAGKAYYLLPKRWGEDAGYSYTMVGSVVGRRKPPPLTAPSRFKLPPRVLRRPRNSTN